MNKDFNHIIDLILKDYNYPQIDIETLKSYYRLLYYDIKTFFYNKPYEIVFNGRLAKRKYSIDMCSFLSIMEIQNEMLEAGIDLHYSLYVAISMSDEQYNKLYLDFVNKSEVYKLDFEKHTNIKTLKLINNLSEKLLLDYFEKN